MMQETPGGHTMLEAGDRVVIVEYELGSDQRRERLARVKHSGDGGHRAALVVFADEPDPELARLRAIEAAAEDWCANAARRFEFLAGTERALYRAVRGA